MSMSYEAEMSASGFISELFRWVFFYVTGDGSAGGHMSSQEGNNHSYFHFDQFLIDFFSWEKTDDF